MRGLQRRLATGLNAVIVAALVVGITATLVELASRERVRWDLSEDSSATLKPETLATLDELSARGERVRVTAFSAQARNGEAMFRDRLVRDFLATLQHASPLLETTFVEMDRDRLTAEQLGVDRYGTIVVQGAGDRVDIGEREIFRRRGSPGAGELDFLGEAAISRGIRQVLSDRTRRIYILSGHGERTLFDRGVGELQTIAGLIEEQGWTFVALDLLADRRDGVPPAVPNDASAVMVIGPSHALTQQEEAALRTYLAGGGGLGVFVEPDGVLPELVEELGLLSPDGVVLSEEFVYPFPERPIVHPVRHPVTEVLLEDRLRAEVAHAAGLERLPVDGVRAAPLLQTGRRGWVERSAERPAVFTPGEDVEGPVVVAWAASLGVPHPLGRGGGRVVVVGDVDVLGDEVINEAPGNRTFVVNLMRWLVRSDDRMSRVGRPGRIRRLTMTPEQLTRVRWLVMGALPLVVLLVGAVVRWRRRRG